MKKWIIIGSLVVVAILLYNLFAGSYNSMVTKNEEVTRAWQDVESDYQRRLDLIPNLVNTVKGYAEFEKSTLTAVIEARASASQVKLDPTNLTPEALKNYQAAQGQVSSALSRLLVTVEQYPDLKANQNFLELQAELAGTENRIKVARNKFNATVQDYNTYIKSFPRNFLSGMFGFTARAYFEADAAASKAPEVKF
ncbi:MAG: LemA family protein [Bacteroidetes bacterium]|nr:LemA family protein [Bacteroidota bacterium]MBK7388648.1 LemA family protein [Bacteroidota bacterium]MBK7971589.1 LemA family protein [Bacteroidota bacterium]MBK8414810.1 LemA family protein [Bacteroidota bacterium]MBK8872950.1 LemA family protein [Bacteroidota bacterium]